MCPILEMYIFSAFKKMNEINTTANKLSFEDLAHNCFTSVVMLQSIL
jgi:hypothetical protein